MDHRGGDMKNQKTSKPEHRQHREKHNEYRRTSHFISSLPRRARRNRGGTARLPNSYPTFEPGTCPYAEPLIRQQISPEQTAGVCGI